MCHVCILCHSVMSDSCQPMDYIAHQAPLFMEFFMKEYCSELPFASPGDLPDPGIEPASAALASKFYTNEPPRNPHKP